MSSINTNVAAMTALQSLTQTQKSLTETQNHISTGMRVAEASDNAAYWSIATTMRSDKASLSTVNDALGLGATLTTRHLLYEKEAEAALGLPPGVHSYAILPIGYPMGKFGPVGRGPLADIVYQDRWGNPYRGV